MKIFTIIFLFCAYASSVIAQPVFSRANIFSPGDKLYTQDAKTIPAAGMAGENVTWDFSTIAVDTSVIGAQIAQADTTPHFSQFPNSNVAEIYTFDGGKSFQYDLINDMKYEVHGTVVPGVYTLLYTNPETYLQFPFTYNSQWQDTYASTLDFVISPISIEDEGTLDARVDGYGTLMLPHTTFTDALRLKLIEESSDTSDLGQGLSEKNVNHDTTYVWFSPSYPGPLCILERSTQVHFVYLTTPDTVIVDSETIKDSSFSLDPMSGTSAVRDEVKPGKYALRVSPNPFEQTIQIDFTSDVPQLMQLLIEDMNGNAVYREAVPAVSGENSTMLSLPEMPSGVYIALLKSSKGADIQKLIRIEGRR